MEYTEEWHSVDPGKRLEWVISFFRGGGSTQPLHFRPVDVHFIHTSSDSSYLRRLSLWVYHERVGGRVQISAEIS